MTTRTPSALRVARGIGVLRDLIVCAVGIIVLIATPPSLVEFGAANIAVAAWSVLPLVGGVFCLVGVLRRHVLFEVVGAFTVASGFTVWTLAVLMSPERSLVSWAIAGAFLILALNSVIRGLLAAVGVLREAA